MKVTLLHNESCPSTDETLARLERILGELGEETDVEVILVDSEEVARAMGFLGSPTVLIDGVDIEHGSATPTIANERIDAVVQACRIYVRPGGRVSPLPPVELIEQAIQRAQRRES